MRSPIPGQVVPIGFTTIRSYMQTVMPLISSRPCNRFKNQYAFSLAKFKLLFLAWKTDQSTCVGTT
jgi:hypothetical protein